MLFFEISNIPRGVPRGFPWVSGNPFGFYTPMEALRN